MSSTLVIIPTFNEAQNIGALVERLCELYSDLDVLVVDDGSPDGTAQVIENLQKTLPRLQLIKRQGKGGRGSAVLAGFTYGLAKDYKIFIEMDADFSHKPEEITGLLQKIEHFDMVSASRYLPGSEIHHWGWKRTVLSWCANKFARMMLRIPMTDYTNGFRCYKRSAVESLRMQDIDAKGYVVLSEVAMQLYRLGKSIGEVPTVFVNRRRGISNLSRHEIREAFLSVIRIRKTYAKWPAVR